MTVKSREILEQIKPEDKNLLKSQELTRKFGREEDCVELHVYDLNGKLLDSVYNFEAYEIPDIDNPEGYFSEITFNPDKVLRDLGYNRGEYELRVNFHRRKIANTLENLFYIDTISPSRTELKVKLKDNENLSSLIFAANQFIAELNDTDEGIAYFKDFALNLDNDVVLTGVNFIAEPGVSNSYFIKLYESLPNSFSEKAQFRIIEELTNPIKYRVDLGTPEITIQSTELRGPNLRIDTRLNSSVPTAYRTFNDILSYTSTGSLNNVLNALSASVPVSVEFDNPNTDSGYVYDKFIHFGSAEERLRNFKYKLELIELYTSKSAYMENLNSDYANSTLKLENETLKNKVTQNFDTWERYMYYEDGDYTWPKSNSSKPYTLYSVTSSQAIDWFNTHVANAEDYDDHNPYILRNTVPQYIIDNEENEQFVTFVDMIGQYFDNIWLYIENITDKNIAHNSLKEGISKDLVFEALKEKGIPAFDQFENANLFEYLIASEGGDTFKYTAPAGQTMISSSNESIPKGDITKEVWKRLYHNAPYLLKTKGTERGIKALLACYGIPESLLHVKEYGGPSADKSGYRTFKYPKITKALHITGSTNSGILITNTSPTVGDGKKYFEFTILPRKKDINNILSTDPGYAPYLAIITSSVYEDSGYFTGSFGTSEEFPAYSGRPITFFVTQETGQLDITASMYIDNGITNVSFSCTDSGNNTVFFIGPSLSKLIYSDFYIHNFKTYQEELTSLTKNIHTKDPNIIAGNTMGSSSAYFDDLNYYAPIGANLITESLDNNHNFLDYSNNGYTNNRLRLYWDPTSGDGSDLAWSNITYDHYISTPDTVGSSMASEKIRYDAGTIDDNILSPTVRAEASALDRQPQDFSNLGVFFSPTFEINEDIIYTLGGFRLDDYIGDPSHLHSGSYPDLLSLREEYGAKVEGRYNFWDYLKTIQYFDHTIFKLIEEFVPAKANLKTGLVIEPHYLERPKLNVTDTDFTNVEIPLFNIPETQPSTEGEYILHETTIDVEQVLDGSGGSFENNFVHSRLSNKYFRIAGNR